MWSLAHEEGSQQFRVSFLQMGFCWQNCVRSEWWWCILQGFALQSSFCHVIFVCLFQGWGPMRWRRGEPQEEVPQGDCKIGLKEVITLCTTTGDKEIDQVSKNDKRWCPIAGSATFGSIEDNEVSMLCIPWCEVHHHPALEKISSSSPWPFARWLLDWNCGVNKSQ